MPKHDEGFFPAKDNLRLFWEVDSPETSRAHVAVIHGYADHCGRYRGVIQAMVGAQLTVHALDYRGHGQADGRRGHCDSFSEFVDDLELFWQRVRAAAGPQKTFILAHSHGGLITLQYLMQRQVSGLAGVVLSAPYLRLALKPPTLKVAASGLLSRIIPWLPIKNEIQPEYLTRDLEAQRAVEKDPLYNRVVTPRWFQEARSAQAQVLQGGALLRVPLFMFYGAEDPIASVSTGRSFFETIASQDKKYKEYPGMRHESMNELGKEAVWSDIIAWLSAHT